MSATPETCLELLQTMVRFDTVNATVSGRPDAEAELAAYLATLGEAWGFRVQRLPVRDRSFNVLITHEVAPAAPWWLFESHMDTVSVAGMSIDPFGGAVRDGRIYGRGACDTKGTGAAMFWALRRYAAERAPRNNIALLFTTDEEISRQGAEAFARRHLPSLPWRPSGAVVGEPTQHRLVTAHNGIVRWSIRTQGRAAHSSTPAEGRSAIRMMMRVIDALETRYIARLSASHPLTGPARCSINMIRGGVQFNIIPEDCEITLDRRVAPGEDAARVLPEVERILDELRTSDPDLRVTQGSAAIGAPLDPAGGEAFIAAASAVLAQKGLPSGPMGAPYATDAAELSAVGIPTVVLGPGNIAQAHTHDEWLSLAELERGIDVYFELMKQLNLTPSSG